MRILPKIWTQENFQYESPTLRIPERQVVPKPVQKPHPPMWVACTQPATLEFAADNGLGVLGFGIGQGQSNDYVRTYRERIKNCKPIGSFINNKFALLTFTLCCDTDEEALAIQGPNFRMYSDAVRKLFAPWIDGKPPRFLRMVHEALAGDYVQGGAIGAGVGNRQGRRRLHRQPGDLSRGPAVPRRCRRG